MFFRLSCLRLYIHVVLLRKTSLTPRLFQRVNTCRLISTSGLISSLDTNRKERISLTLHTSYSNFNHLPKYTCTMHTVHCTLYSVQCISLDTNRMERISLTCIVTWTTYLLTTYTINPESYPVNHKPQSHELWTIVADIEVKNSDMNLNFCLT